MADWLSARNVSFCYGRRLLFDRLSLTVPNRSPVLTIVGASGIGKSTLLALLAGHHLSEGTVLLCGELVTGPSPRRPMVFQDHNLFPWMTVLDNVVFGLKCLGVPPRERRERGRALLARMRLDHVLEDYPATLSGGMRQRVGLARALAVEPACLLLDEAFHALDVANREQLRDEVVGLAATTGLRAVAVTHDLEEAVVMGTSVLVLQGPGEATSLDLTALPWPRPEGWRDTPACRDAVAVLRRLITAAPAERRRPLPMPSDAWRETE
ncbi:ABC transporter ATP-binding protein [Azospirillum sp. B506]|uniref:ABC transporter ATP-binding protein n=1 Tax=Azospirillum sp. B506 TaxID=137721 RepID=UPI000348DB17|nr:ABC transporter ATP-binding protein [Azospirillum sp. B506]